MIYLVEDILRLRKQGVGFRKIAKRLGVSRDKVRSVCRKHDLGGFLGAKEKVPKPDKVYICRNCGSLITERKKKHCSDFCRREWNKKNPATYEGFCLFCGKQFISTYKKQKYCSVTCRGLSRRTLKGTTRECIICGNKFEPRTKTGKCCSKECQIIQTHNVTNESEKILKKICPLCGEEFCVSRYHWYSIYCSRRCKDKAWNYKKRAILNSVKSEAYSIQEIYNRDSWYCQLCGKRVDPELKWPDPKSASIDHIIPISKGGNDIKSNVQLAHLGCNLAKGNKIGVTNKEGQLC